MDIQIRPVESGDLPILFEFQLDAESNQMAFTHPRSKEEFDSHWEKSLADPKVVVRSIIVGDSLAGSIACFNSEDKNCIGYWIGKPFWGKGIATAALKLLLAEIETRPLHSRVAITNVASIRVLEKCGFQEVGREWSPASDRYVECEEVVMRLTESKTSNLFTNIPDSLSNELVDVLASNDSVRIERIVSTGHQSPSDFWYDQDENEWVVVLKGAAKLRFDDGREFEMRAGDHILIEAHQKHRVEWTSDDEPTFWLAVFFK